MTTIPPKSRRCATCKMWKGKPPSEIRQTYRACTRPAPDGKHRGFRDPADWCSHHEPK